MASLIEEIADATIGATRKEYLADMASVPLIIDDLDMRKLPPTAAVTALLDHAQVLKCGPNGAFLELLAGLTGS